MRHIITSGMTWGAVLVLLAGCTTYLDNVDVKKVHLGDGTRAYRVSCNSNPRQSANDCYEQAGHLCGDQGYSVIRQDGLADENSGASPVNDVFVRCR